MKATWNPWCSGPVRGIVVAGALVGVVAGCGRKQESVAEGAEPRAAQAAVAVPAEPVAPRPADGEPAAPAAAEAAPAAAPAPDPMKNAWGLPARGTSAQEGGRVYVLTQGKDRTYMNADAVYHLFAHDLGEVSGDRITVKELGGGNFQVTGLFVIPAGVDKADAVKAGDMVLAEWASSLKHAVVTKVDGDKITVRYTDLPDSWSEDKLTGVLSPRQVTKQAEGLQPGNFAVATEDGKRVQVLLIAESGDKWLVRRFAGRVAVFAKADLTPIPLAPKLKPGQMVQAPWVGAMYPGKVKKVKGTRVEVAIEGIASKEPVVAALGQVLPEAK